MQIGLSSVFFPFFKIFSKKDETYHAEKKKNFTKHLQESDSFGPSF